MMVMDLGEFKIDSVKQERVSALPSPTELTGDYQVWQFSYNHSHSFIVVVYCIFTMKIAEFYSYIKKICL